MSDFLTYVKASLALFYLCSSPPITMPRGQTITHEGGPVSGCAAWQKMARMGESQRLCHSCSHLQSSLRGEGAGGAGSPRGSSPGGSRTFPLSPSRWSALIAGELTGTCTSHRHPLGKWGSSCCLLFPQNLRPFQPQHPPVPIKGLAENLKRISGGLTQRPLRRGIRNRSSEGQHSQKRCPRFTALSWGIHSRIPSCSLTILSYIWSMQWGWGWGHILDTARYSVSQVQV